MSYNFVGYFSGADLSINENENLPRPEEERITQAEKNKRMQEQLKVIIVTKRFAYHCILHLRISNRIKTFLPSLLSMYIYVPFVILYHFV